MGRTLTALALLVATFVVALGATVALGYGEPTRVETRGEMRAVRGGMPFDYVTQDVSSLDPPLPATVSTGSPWSYATETDGRWFLVDLACCWVALAVLTAGSIVAARRWSGG